MTAFLTALGLAIVIEGVCYALFPDAMKKMMLSVLEQPSSALRMFGVTAAIVGVDIIWLIRGLVKFLLKTGHSHGSYTFDA